MVCTRHTYLPSPVWNVSLRVSVFKLVCEAPFAVYDNLCRGWGDYTKGPLWEGHSSTEQPCEWTTLTPTHRRSSEGMVEADQRRGCGLDKQGMRSPFAQKRPRPKVRSKAGRSAALQRGGETLPRVAGEVVSETFKHRCVLHDTSTP